MIWINKVILENFQSHKYSELEFDEGLNAIIGTTDSGKTAIFRAIKWALYNEPQGDYFIREGEDYVSVKVFFNSGVVVNRYRKKNKNGYELTNPDGTVDVFEGFGVRVPDEIIEATNIRKVNFTPSENRSLNMAEQLDSPFLLSESPRLKAAAIGKLVEADVVDYALGQTNTDLKRKRKHLEEAKDNLDKIKEDLKTYEYLDNLKDTLYKLEEMQRKKEKLENRLRVLESLKLEYDSTLNHIEDYRKIIKGLSIAKKGEYKYLEVEKLYLQLNSLSNLSDNLKKSAKNISGATSIIDKLKVADEIGNDFPKLELKYKKILALNDTFNRYKKIQKEKSMYEEILLDLKEVDKLSRIQEQLDKKYSTFKELHSKNSILKVSKERISKGEVYLKSLGQIERSEELFTKINNKYSVLSKLNLISLELKKNTDEINREKNLLNKQEESIRKNITFYNEILSEARICPTCFKDVDYDDIDHILSHLLE